MQIPVLSLIFIGCLAGSAGAELCIVGDLTGDNRVDFNDLAVMGRYWLERPEPFYESDGLVVFEAEHYYDKSSGGGLFADHAWEQITGEGAVGNWYMRALPDGWAAIDNDIEKYSPRLSYLIDFNRPAEFYLWLKGMAVSGQDDSVHFGLDGETISSNRYTSASIQQGVVFAWKSRRGDETRRTLMVPSSGQHTLDIWMREDGAKIDRVLLTTESTYSPDEPSESVGFSRPADLDDNHIIDLSDFAILAQQWLAHSITLVHGQDGYSGGSSCFVSFYDPDTNFGDWPYLRVRSTNARKTLLKWSGLNETALGNMVVTGAALHLYVYSCRNPEGVDITIHQVITDWDAMATTWNRRSAVEFWCSSGMKEGVDYESEPVGLVLGPEEGFTGWIEVPIDVSVIQEWLAYPEYNCGLVIKAICQGQPGLSAWFYSNAYEDFAVRPQLVVTVIPGSPGPLALPLDRQVDSDFVLAAYKNKETATLVLQPTTFATKDLDLEISFAERTTAAVPREPVLVTMSAWPDPTNVAIDIRDWPDGEYTTTIRESRGDGKDTGSLVRFLRKQTVPLPKPPAEPVVVEGIRMLFLDDWYLQQRSGLRFRVHPAEAFSVTTGMLGENRPMQRGLNLSFEPDGTAVVKLKDWDRNGQNPIEHTARSSDLVNWDIIEAGGSAGAAAGYLSSLSYRYYDPQIDGPVVLEQVNVRYSGYEPTQWGDVNIPARSTIPVWEKSPAEYLILLKEPLITDKAVFEEGESGEWSNSNDNFGGQWLSANGSTLHYSQSRTIPRCDPFRIYYDNLSMCNRIMVVWSTGDGVNWEPTYFTMPSEEDPFGYTHYGANGFWAEGKNLRLAYLFAYNQAWQQIYLELVYSRDGVLWHRFIGEPAFVANGPVGSWNFGWMFVGAGPVEKDGMAHRLLSYCSNYPHFFYFICNREDVSGITAEWLEERFRGTGLTTQWPYWSSFGSWEAMADYAAVASQTVGLMRYRRDGWVSIAPEQEQGALVTKVLQAGQMLAINARTEPSGFIKVEVLDSAGQEIAGYCNADAALFTGDSTSEQLSWNNGAVQQLPAVPLRLRITIDHADMFSLEW